MGAPAGARSGVGHEAHHGLRHAWSLGIAGRRVVKVDHRRAPKLSMDPGGPSAMPGPTADARVPKPEVDVSIRTRPGEFDPSCEQTAVRSVPTGPAARIAWSTSAGGRTQRSALLSRSILRDP